MKIPILEKILRPGIQTIIYRYFHQILLLCLKWASEIFSKKNIDKKINWVLPQHF